MKFLKIPTLVDNHGLTVCCSKRKHHCKVPLGEISGAIIEVACGFINIPGKGEELKNLGTDGRDKAESSNIAMRQGIRICWSYHLHIYLLLS